MSNETAPDGLGGGEAAPSRFALRDLVSESAAALTARPSRTALTTVGTILGVGTFVVIVSLTATIQRQVDSRFNALIATTVQVQDARVDPNQQPFPFTDQARLSAEQLNGVVAVGTRWELPAVTIRSSQPGFGDDSLVPVFAASTDLWRVIDPTFGTGRPFDAFHQANQTNVVVLGSSAARELGIESLINGPAIFLDDRPYVVIGIIDSVSRESDLLLGAIIPSDSAIVRWGEPDEKSHAKFVILTELGAAAQVAQEVPFASSVLDLSAVRAIPPPDPRTLRDAVSTDLTSLFLALAAVCLAIGTIGIANTTLIAVVERTGEIGLRRALGARRSHIGAQIVAESAALGLVGGALGASIGVLTVLIAALAQHWAPVVDPTLCLIAPLVGLATGSVAGLYPAFRATRIEPSEALRR